MVVRQDVIQHAVVIVGVGVKLAQIVRAVLELVIVVVERTAEEIVQERAMKVVDLPVQ